MPAQRSNEDQAVRISKSIFVTNIPEKPWVEGNKWKVGEECDNVDECKVGWQASYFKKDGATISDNFILFRHMVYLVMSNTFGGGYTHPQQPGTKGDHWDFLSNNVTEIERLHGVFDRIYSVYWPCAVTLEGDTRIHCFVSDPSLVLSSTIPFLRSIPSDIWFRLRFGHIEGRNLEGLLGTVARNKYPGRRRQANKTGEPSFEHSLFVYLGVRLGSALSRLGQCLIASKRNGVLCLRVSSSRLNRALHFVEVGDALSILAKAPLWSKDCPAIKAQSLIFIVTESPRFLVALFYLNCLESEDGVVQMEISNGNNIIYALLFFVHDASL
ncbi:hypothetical protein Tco_1484484 [Tanacetum coccineum]